LESGKQLVSLGVEEAKTSIKFVNLLTPHPQPLSLPLGEGGRRPGEGAVYNGDATLGDLRLLPTTNAELPR